MDVEKLGKANKRDKQKKKRIIEQNKGDSGVRRWMGRDIASDRGSYTSKRGRKTQTFQKICIN